MIRLYTGADCPWCKKVKAYLDSKNVEYKELDVALEENKEELLSLTRQRSIPVLATDDNKNFAIGFDKRAIDVIIGN